MREIILAVSCAFSLAACASTSLLASNFEEPRQSVKVLIMEPDVKMNFMTTTGSELRVDWSETAKTNLVENLQVAITEDNDTFVSYVPQEDMGAEAQQMMLLNETVTLAMKLHVGVAGSNVIPTPLPHKEDAPFDYSLGESVRQMAEGYEADYALFLTANSQFESSGVIFRNLLIAAATGAATGGAYVAMPASQSYKGVFITLVDLENGNVVWANGSTFGDPRDPETAQQIINGIMKKSPLGAG